MPAWPRRTRASLTPRGRPGAVHNALEGTVAVGCAFAVMTGVAALGLHLAGAGEHGSLVPMTAAVVALAVGGTASLSADLGTVGAGESPASLPQGLLGGEGFLEVAGGINLMPLGVTLAGAVTLAAAFLLPLRGRPPLGAPGLAVRVGAAAATSPAFLLAVPMAGRGTLSLDALPGGSLPGRPGGLGDPLGGDGAGGAPSGFLGGDAAAVTSVNFHTEVFPTLSGGLLGVLVVLAIGWLALRRVPLPLYLPWLERTARPAVSAVVTTGVAVALLVTALAMVPIAGGAVALEVAFAALLAAPNLLIVALSAGLGVPWSGGLEQSGARGGLLPSGPAGLPGEDGTFFLSLASLPGPGPARWLLPVATALLVMLPCGVLAAARARGKGSCAGRMAWALLRARDLGAVMAVALPALTALGGVSGHLRVSIFGRELVAAGVGLHGSVPLATALGALTGAAAGLLGSLLLDAVGSSRPQPPRAPSPTTPTSAPEPTPERG